MFLYRLSFLVVVSDAILQEEGEVAATAPLAPSEGSAPVISPTNAPNSVFSLQSVLNDVLLTPRNEYAPELAEVTLVSHAERMKHSLISISVMVDTSEDAVTYLDSDVVKRMEHSELFPFLMHVTFGTPMLFIIWYFCR